MPSHVLIMVMMQKLFVIDTAWTSNESDGTHFICVTLLSDITPHSWAICVSEEDGSRWIVSVDNTRHYWANYDTKKLYAFNPLDKFRVLQEGEVFLYDAALDTGPEGEKLRKDFEIYCRAMNKKYWEEYEQRQRERESSEPLL